MQKRALAAHDICCVGRCSLTVALPILSAAGIQTSVLPTALLSTHTGEFTDYTYLELSDQLLPIANHLHSLDLPMDAFYSGYLASSKQVTQILQIIHLLGKKNTHIFVDPAFADHGKLYSLLDNSMPEQMKLLCSHAHTIVPNLTEAALMLNIPYPGDLQYTPCFVNDLAHKLCSLGPKNVVITSISFDSSATGIAIYQRGMEEPVYAFTKQYEGIFHGTGDVFASFLLAALLNDKSLLSSARLALRLTHDSIVRTLMNGSPLRFGLQFEEILPKMWRSLKKHLSAMPDDINI